ncbi:hypothetical protein like AT2G42900 [Hibiscus trionum]|uniref:Uncharacterized protein n=1 Tax=Hibiscus trionum TaxID=183268 RepID=A0A9W7M422_HIBTR|nr:hypothetical protein like AT2G42900 [Hibiscus trionum]
MEDYTLSIPLLTTTATATATATKEDAENGVSSSTTSGIICRLLLLILIAAISVWANHEASKGFKVTVINNAAVKDSSAGRRFHLFYISNDEATRIILNTSALVENILYPNHRDQSKKPVHHVVLQLAAGDQNPSTTKVSVATTSKGKESVYVISLSPSIMEEGNVKYSVISAIQRAMARIWLWDGAESSAAPPWLIDGMAEYIWTRAGFGHRDEETTLHSGWKDQFCCVVSELCSKSKMNKSGACGDHRKWTKSGGVCNCGDDRKDPKIVAGALGYLEQRNKGYVQGLNRSLRDGWD